MLSDPEIISDNTRYRALSREYSGLEPAASALKAYENTEIALKEIEKGEK